MCFFFFKQKTAYEMRISDWSSDVCSSDLQSAHFAHHAYRSRPLLSDGQSAADDHHGKARRTCHDQPGLLPGLVPNPFGQHRRRRIDPASRSEEHTSELQSLMRISYAVFCLKKKKHTKKHKKNTSTEHTT